MPFIDVNGANLYYETFGRRQPGSPPIVLIHGSTGTGQSNWSLVAPLLARQHFVIVPDCRGHGQSSNPNKSYSFKEMASDTAGLVRALGFQTAHIIGHSNGGNVALVVLMEHPEVVQTAVLQAANAYVSLDLVEKEPAIFDPERVAREAPEWMNEMVALHGSTHGEEYWRDLLRLTVEEIVTQPNYTPEQLACVERPTLVIQGENDRVNAPARHAQFIANNIPFAELWLPAGVAHTVHDEVLFAWVERVLDFIARRGDDANDALYRLGRSRYSDDRVMIFAPRFVPNEPGPAGKPGGGKLVGPVLTAEARAEALSTVASLRLGRGPGEIATLRDELSILLTPSTPWALVRRTVTDLRREPRSLAERVSQALLGEPVRVLEEGSDWTRIRTVRDDYIGWIHTGALQPSSEAGAADYRSACTHLVLAQLLPAVVSPAADSGEAGKLPFGIPVQVVESSADLSAIRLPDGRVWWVKSDGLLPVESRLQPDAVGIQYTLDLIRRFIGVPYLWGGRSPFGYDCSGLAQTFAGFMGVQIPRDADQQFHAAKPVDGKPQPGDLFYFGNPTENGDLRRFASISHVAISLGGDEMIHANGAAWGTSYNSLDPSSPIYRAWLREHLIGVGRFW